MKANSTPFFGNVERFDIKIKKGFGSTLVDENDKMYLDFWSDESTQGAGYATSIIDELYDEMKVKSIPHQLPDIYTNDIRTKAAELLVEKYGFEKILF